MRLSTFALFLAASVSASCAQDDPCVSSEEQWVQLGKEYPAFTPLAPFDQLEVVRGPQGGFHVLIDVETFGVTVSSSTTRDDPSIAIRMYSDDQEIAGFAPTKRAFLAEGLFGYLTGELVVFRDDSRWERPVELRVQVEDRCGVTATSSQAVELAYE